jgi:hypothetical protein
LHHLATAAARFTGLAGKYYHTVKSIATVFGKIFDFTPEPADARVGAAVCR